MTRKMTKKRGGKRGDRQFAPNILHKINKPYEDITLTAAASVSSAATGLNGILVDIFHGSFAGFQRLANIYKYFEITGLKLDFTLATTTAATDSFNGGSVAYVPINYVLGENPGTGPGSTPGSIAQVQDLAGAINVQSGASNRGKWFPTLSKQFYSCSAVISNNTRAGQIVAYFDDIGPSETVGDVVISMNVRFSCRQYAYNEA